MLLRDALDLFKNLLVCCCLFATLSSQCRQEQTNDKLTAQIAALKSVCVEMEECVYHVDEPEPSEE